MNFENKTLEDLKSDLLLLENRLPYIEDKKLVREYRDTIANLQDEINRRDVPAPLTGPGSHLNGGGSSYGKPVFNSFGEQLVAIKNAHTPGGQVDNRLHLVNAATGLSESVSSDGGFLIEKQFSDELLQAAFEVGQIAKLCRRVTIGGNANGIKIPGLDETSRATGSRWGGCRSYWVDEAAEKTASKPKFRQIELELKKAAVLVYATDELLQDSRILADVIGTIARDELAFTLDDVILNGTGAGQPLGILNSGALVTQDAEGAQAADTVLWENIVKMWSRMLPSARKNAVWLMNQDIESQLYSMSLSTGTAGVPVFMPAGGASSGPYSTLFSKPLIPVEQCATLGDVGDIILADFSTGYILAEKGGVKSDMSIHVRFIYDESVFRFVLRVDGQPVLSAPITPYKGSATQSHFVALAAR